jgi:predicted nucleic acid-binding protein
MNGNKLFLDTNIIVYFLEGDDTLASFLHGRTIYISFITQLELLSHGRITTDEEEKIEQFLSNCIVTDINPVIKKEAIRLRKRYRLKLPDSIVMATSLYHDLPLVTSDKEFNKIEELQVIYYEK